jgi:Calcineurin-like phosphoesterase
MSPPVVVLGDLHLTPETPPVVTDDLVRLLDRHPDATVACAGDLFDLSADGRRRPHAETVRATLGRHPGARAALAAHVDRGGELWLVSGNHDADLGDAGFRAALVDALGVAPSARGRLRTTPWFFRRGALHVEHGHLFDPDNAPAHPLVVGHASLGVHFVEEFVAPTGAHRYLNANDGTPLSLFLSAFTWYGPRAPYVVYSYFHAAFRALARSGPFYRAAGERQAGEARLAAFAEEAGVDAELLARLVGLGAAPTLESLAGTFTRLYFDRVLCTLAIAGGLGAAVAGRRVVGSAVAALGALAMGASWATGHDRYGGAVEDRLAAGAAAVAGATGARLVVFGHTHREAQADGYANTGSFAFPQGAPGRPYLVVDGPADRPRAERRYVEA